MITALHCTALPYTALQVEGRFDPKLWNHWDRDIDLTNNAAEVLSCLVLSCLVLPLPVFSQSGNNYFFHGLLGGKKHPPCYDFLHACAKGCDIAELRSCTAQHCLLLRLFVLFVLSSI